MATAAGMPEPLKATALRGLGEPRGSFLVVDPGKRCGMCVYYGQGRTVRAYTVMLDELSGLLYVNMPRVAFAVCEDFHLLGGKAKQQAGSDMPSAQGIGMCRTACDWTDTPLYLVPPGCKTAGHAALDAAGRAAYDVCRNDHERDVIDLASYVLREMRRT